MVNTLVLYSIASLAVTVIPGPTMLLALSNGTKGNYKVVNMGILGAACSDLVLIALVATGLGAVMATSEVLFCIIKYIGVIYLFWLAYNLWKSEPSTTMFSTENADSEQSPAPRHAFYKSFFAAISNPKGLLFFSAFLPQFLDTATPQLPQYVAFALATVTIDITIMVCYALAGFHAARYLSRFRLKLLNRSCAAILVFMASGLLMYRRSS